MHSGKVLDVADGSLDNGGNVIIWSANDGDNQKWRLERAKQKRQQATR
ncbi:RICIN domain-containing protein [Streptomyces sp. NPDC050355]